MKEKECVCADDQLNLVQKLAKIREIVDVVTKSKRGYGYTYADINDILAKIRAGMKKYGVSLIPQIVPGTMSETTKTYVNTKTDKAGEHYDQTSTEILVSGDMVYRWVNDSSPSQVIDVPWFVIGAQSDPSQAFGSGLSYCERYFISNYFQLPQVEQNDVDAYRSKQKAAEAAEDLAVAEELINQFDVKLRAFLADSPDKAEEVKKFTTKYARAGNYKAIKEPSLASKLLADFTDKYIDKGDGK